MGMEFICTQTVQFTKENGSTTNNTETEQKNGQVTLYDPHFIPADGACFKGNYIQGKKNGKGHFQWADNSSYVGEFRDNNIEGKGVYTWSDNRKFEGEWKNNKMEGVFWPFFRGLKR